MHTLHAHCTSTACTLLSGSVIPRATHCACHCARHRTCPCTGHPRAQRAGDLRHRPDEPEGRADRLALRSSVSALLERTATGSAAASTCGCPACCTADCSCLLRAGAGAGGPAAGGCRDRSPSSGASRGTRGGQGQEEQIHQARGEEAQGHGDEGLEELAWPQNGHMRIAELLDTVDRIASTGSQDEEIFA